MLAAHVALKAQRGKVEGGLEGGGRREEELCVPLCYELTKQALEM